jgi:hypothetical protein
VANKWGSGDEPNWFLGACLHSRIPASEDLALIAVDHLGANLQQQMSASLGPVHLLLLDHSAADALVHGRFCKRGADSFAIAMTITVVRDEGLIGVAMSLPNSQIVHSSFCRSELIPSPPSIVFNPSACAVLPMLCFRPPDTRFERLAQGSSEAQNKTPFYSLRAQATDSKWLRNGERKCVLVPALPELEDSHQSAMRIRALGGCRATVSIQRRTT